MGWLSTDGARGRFYRGVEQFCCAEYVAQAVDRIRLNWQPAGNPHGPATVIFTIGRDGRIADANIEQSSGDIAFDHSAVNAVEQTQQVSALPADFLKPTLTIHLFVGPNSSFGDVPGAREPVSNARPIQVPYAGQWTLIPGSVTGHIPGLPAAAEMEITLSQDLLTITRDRVETQTYRGDGAATDLTGYRKGTLTMDGEVLTLTTTRVRPGSETVTIVRDTLAFSADDLVVTRTLRVERPAGVDLGVPRNRWEARYTRR
jgi:TonB family protein